MQKRQISSRNLGLEQRELLKDNARVMADDMTALQECAEYCTNREENKGNGSASRFDSCFAGCVFGEGFIWTTDAVGTIFGHLSKMLQEDE